MSSKICRLAPGWLACAGYEGGGWATGNLYSRFQTAPQLYNISAPLGSRWTGLLADSGIGRGYHNGALLIASAEVGSQRACHWQSMAWACEFCANQQQQAVPVQADGGG